MRPARTKPFANKKSSILPYKWCQATQGTWGQPGCPHAELTPPPCFSRRSGARSCFPGLGIFKQLLPALGRWHQRLGLEPEIRECGKRLVGDQGQRCWSIPEQREDN